MSLREHIRDSYPYKIREDAFIENSNTYYYDSVRAILFEYIETLIKDNSKELVLETATEIGVGLMEDFLGLSINSTKTLDERKLLLLTTLFNGKSTVQAIKTFLYTALGGDSTVVQIKERWKENAVGNEVFNYYISIRLALMTKDINLDTIKTSLNNIHPFHCNVDINIIEGGLDNVFVWGEEGSAFTSTTWSEGDILTEGQVWG